MATTKKTPPTILYGQIVCGHSKPKIGSFHLEYNKWSDRMEYLYHTPKGKRGTGGFTVERALKLLELNLLSTNPEDGKKENYL